MKTWVAALDDFEDRLSLAEAMLELGVDAEPPAGFQVPEIAGPFPAELLERAGTLLVRAGAVEQRLRDEQSRIRAELSKLPKAPAAERRSGSQFEFEA